MSEIIQQAEELRSRAIAVLVSEKNAIEDELRLLRYDGDSPNDGKYAKRKACGLCGDATHNARTCPNKKGTSEAPVIQSA